MRTAPWETRTQTPPFFGQKIGTMHHDLVAWVGQATKGSKEGKCYIVIPPYFACAPLPPILLFLRNIVFHGVRLSNVITTQEKMVIAARRSAQEAILATSPHRDGHYPSPLIEAAKQPLRTMEEPLIIRGTIRRT